MRSVAIPAAVASALLMLSLAGCVAQSPQPAPHRVTGSAHVNVTYTGLQFIDPSGRVVHTEAYSVSPSAFREYLVSVFGKPVRIEKPVEGEGRATARYTWRGLEVDSHMSAEENNEVYVSSAKVNGVPITALGKYAVDGEFPVAGSQKDCFPGDDRRNIVFGNSGGTGEVGLVNGKPAASTVSALMAPEFVQGC